MTRAQSLYWRLILARCTVFLVILEADTMIDERLAHCWKIQDCGTCLKSDYRCGWCPYSSTCIPANSLFDPVSNADICPHWAERWELRTRPLGCYCSTITLLTALITIACTVVALFVLYGVWKVSGWVNTTWGTGCHRGWRLNIDEDGRRRGGSWYRSNWWKPSWPYRRLPN